MDKHQYKHKLKGINQSEPPLSKLV